MGTKINYVSKIFFYSTICIKHWFKS